jgi:hypothetical protein
LTLKEFEMAYGITLAAICGIALLYLVVSFARFAAARKAEAKAPDGIKTHAGGDLIIQGGKTYYVMPSGQRRKIADYPMDLTPASPDMQRFEAVLAEAYKKHMAEKDEMHRKAVESMHEVAKEAVRG